MARRRKVSLNPRKRRTGPFTVGAILQPAARVLVDVGLRSLHDQSRGRKGRHQHRIVLLPENKDALLSELMRRHIDEIERGVEEMAVPRRDDAAGQLAWRSCRTSTPLIGQGHRYSSKGALASLTNWKATYTRRMRLERVRAAFELRRSEIRVPDLDLAVYMVTSAVEAVVHNAVSERTAVKSGALAAELARMLAVI